jgi:hypothetical protein
MIACRPKLAGLFKGYMPGLEISEEIPQAIILTGQKPNHVLQAVEPFHPCNSPGPFLSNYTESGSVACPLDSYYTASRSYICWFPWFPVETFHGTG